MSSSKKPVSLFLTRLTPPIWAQFYAWYEHRQEDHRPVIPPHGIWVISDRLVDIPMAGLPEPVPAPELVAGCCIFPCDGPYAVAEFVSTNPFLPPKLIHLAFERVCMAMNYYGNMVGKTVIEFPKHKGVKRLMRKTGHNDVKPEVSLMWSSYSTGVGVYQPERPEKPATMEANEAAE